MKKARLFGYGLLGLAVGAALATVATAARYAWLAVTPPGDRVFDLDVLDVQHRNGVVTLPRTADTLLPGNYSLVFDSGKGHAVVGEIEWVTTDTVTRKLLRVDAGVLTPGIQVRFSGWLYLHPEQLCAEKKTLEFSELELATPAGVFPAWLVRKRAKTAANGKSWAIHIHGRASDRAETLRSANVLSELDYVNLLVSYRNDYGLVHSAERRYALGAEEWRDVEAALEYAVQHGAERIVLYGWSMGAAISLQLAQQSEFRDRIIGIVLDSPALDWREILTFHGSLAKVPRLIPALGMWLLENGVIRSGSSDGIPFEQLHAGRAVGQITPDVLVLHSVDDGYVPFEAAARLKQQHPERVTLCTFNTARHTKLYNYDETRYREQVSSWLAER